MICEAIEIGNTYVANINVTITAPGRYEIVLDDLSPDSFLIEAGASGDGRFAINSDPGQPCPYSAIEFVFTVGTVSSGAGSVQPSGSVSRKNRQLV